jgi:hypothetical protein
MEGTVTKFLKELLFMLVVWFIVFVTCVSLAHCTTTKHNESNAFGAVISDINPYSYLAGSVKEVYDVESERGMVVRIQPISTHMLYVADVLFCGFSPDMLEGKQNPVVLVYETQAHKMIEGIGCHLLVNVLEIKGDKHVGN